MQERFNKDLEEIKKSQNIMNNAINEIKNTLEATNSRITEAEDRISELEDRMVEINESERKKEKLIKRNEDNLRDFQDSIKCYNIWIVGVPEEEDKKKDHEKILEEIIVETQRINIKSSKGKTTNNTQGNSHKDNSWSFNRNSSSQEDMARHT